MTIIQTRSQTKRLQFPWIVGKKWIKCHTICFFQQHYYCTIKILIIETKEVAHTGNSGFLFRIRTQGT